MRRVGRYRVYALHRRREPTISIGLFLICFALGAGAIAIWFEVRFPQLAPSRLSSALIQVGLAMLCGRLIVPVLHLVTGSAPATLAVLISIVFPALVYVLLTGLWMMKILQRSLGGLR